jgi:hypothetical protein
MIGSVVNLPDFSQEQQQRWEASTSLEHRKRFGQFFTPKPICRFMARLFSLPNDRFRLLDPGAGVGSLTAAVCERFCRLNSARHLEVHLFENDSAVIPLLEENLRLCRRSVEAAGHTIHQFEQARLVDRNPDEPKRPTNSGKTVYRLTEEAVAVLSAYGSRRFEPAVAEFLRTFGSPDLAYQCQRQSLCIPLSLPGGVRVPLSPGEHMVHFNGPRFLGPYTNDTGCKP